MTNEKNLEHYLKKIIHANGGLSLKWTSSVRGVPDQIVLLPSGGVVFVELKAPAGKTAKLQIHMHQKLRRLNQAVHICRTTAEVDALAAVLTAKGGFRHES